MISQPAEADRLRARQRRRAEALEALLLVCDGGSGALLEPSVWAADLRAWRRGPGLPDVALWGPAAGPDEPAE